MLAFYQARVFSAETIAPYDDARVFSFEVRNTGRGALRLRLADWRAEDRISSVRFTLPDAWEAGWAWRAAGSAHRFSLGAVSGRAGIRAGRLDHGHGGAGAAPPGQLPHEPPLSQWEVKP